MPESRDFLQGRFSGELPCSPRNSLENRYLRLEILPGTADSSRDAPENRPIFPVAGPLRGASPRLPTLPGRPRGRPFRQGGALRAAPGIHRIDTPGTQMRPRSPRLWAAQQLILDGVAGPDQLFQPDVGRCCVDQRCPALCLKGSIGGARFAPGVRRGPRQSPQRSNVLVIRRMRILPTISVNKIPIWLLGDAPKSPSAAAPVSPLSPAIRCFLAPAGTAGVAWPKTAFACSRRLRPRFNLSDDRRSSRQRRHRDKDSVREEAKSPRPGAEA